MDKIIHIILIRFKTPQPNVFLETNLNNVKTRLCRLPKQELTHKFE